MPNPTIDPKNELPAPHDMQLSIGHWKLLRKPTTNEKIHNKWSTILLGIVFFFTVLLFIPIPNYHGEIVCTATDPCPETNSGWFLGYSLWDRLNSKPINPENSIQITPQPPTPTPDPTADWKTYINQQIVQYQVDYPTNWKVTPIIQDGKASVRFTSPETEVIQLNCPRGVDIYRTQLPNPYDWEPNEDGFTTKYFHSLTLNGMKGVKYIWASPNILASPNIGDVEYSSGSLHVSLLRPIDPFVCEFSTDIQINNTNYEALIESKTTFNQILSTFKFTNESLNTTQKTADQMAQIAKKDLAKKLAVNEESVSIIEAKQINWSDSSLGCPEPGKVYLQVITPGYEIILESNGETYKYHTDSIERSLECR